MEDGLFHGIRTLNKPPQILLTVMANLESNHMIHTPQMSETLRTVAEKNNTSTSPFAHPGGERDQVFDNKYDHEESATDCGNCDHSHLLARTPRTSDSPCVYYGLIASGNQVMKDGLTRD
jgi:hypothetical protein